MPIYEYACIQCGEIFEVFYKKIGDEPFAPCKSCGGTGKRIMSSTGQFLIKGYNARNGYSPEGYANQQVERAKGHNKELYKSNPEKFASKPGYVTDVKESHLEHKRKLGK